MRIKEIVIVREEEDDSFDPPSPINYPHGNGWIMYDPDSPTYVAPSPSVDEEEQVEEVSIYLLLSVPASPARHRPDRKWNGRMLSRSQSLEHLPNLLKAI